MEALPCQFVLWSYYDNQIDSWINNINETLLSMQSHQVLNISNLAIAK